VDAGKAGTEPGDSVAIGAGGHAAGAALTGGGNAIRFGFRLNKREKNPNCRDLRCPVDGAMCRSDQGDRGDYRIIPL
jgi:hypothetical protein